MFPVYLYSLYIHDSSLSTWHDFIWTLCIKRNDLFVCISWGIVSLPIRKSWFLSPVDSEYIHYFVHVAANIFWLTGLYRFILCIVAAFYSKDLNASWHFVQYSWYLLHVDIIWQCVGYFCLMCLLKKWKRFCAICFLWENGNKYVNMSVNKSIFLVTFFFCWFILLFYIKKKTTENSQCQYE